jgi:peptide/nickel transport system substrate-binding protein
VKRQLTFLLSLVILTSLVLTACGGATPVVTVEPAEPAEPAEPTAPEATEEPAATEPPAEPTAVPKVPIASFDGTSLVAEDCDYGGFFQSIEATDQYTVTFNLCKTDAAFLSKIAFSPFAIYPSEWIEATSGDEVRTTEGVEKPIGTGPYMVSEWNRGENVTFVKNPNYWGETPLAAETLVFRWSTESAARLLELQSGTIDGFDNVGPDDFAVVEGDANLQLAIRPALNVFYIGMTNTFPPFDDVRVRQAIAMGIDRQRIVDTFYPVGSEVASHFTPCSIPNACAGDAWYDFDVDAAKALLADAGYPDGFSTSLYYRDVVRGYLPQVPNVAQDIQAQLLENLNIDAQIEVMESGTFIEASASGQLNGFHLLGWGADYPHVTNFLDYHFGRDTQQFGAIDPSIYEPLIAGGQIGIPEDAEEHYVAANNAIRELVPMIPVAHGGSAAAYRADVENPQASPLTSEVFAYSRPGDRDVFVWMQNAEPNTLFCADETDGEGLRACEQFMEGLYVYEVNGTEAEPALAESCEPNEDSTVWVCTLRQGVTFHDGSDLDSADVVATFNMGLNPGSDTHKGNTNLWEYYDYLWGMMWK